MKQLRMYKTPDGKVPFREWLDDLSGNTRARILATLERMALGGSRKNIKPVGDRVFELKIDTGPGYRCYFVETEKVVILLLLGGDKSTQDRDIKKAIMYWRQYETK